MSTFVFLGPSLARNEAERILDAEYLPPVRQGQVLELVESGLATRIAVIDGHFNQVPALWHKELLFALDHGVAVHGAASMGALRAAEMGAFGMHGVGVIFSAYRDGRYPGFPGERFEDDDEVAIVHGPGEVGHRAASEAMVNIRSTLNGALAAGVIDAHAHALLAAAAKARFYAERSLQACLEDGAADGLDAAMLERLRHWWPRSRVDQKAADARALLSRLATQPTQAPRPAFRFEHTSAFDDLVQSVRRRAHGTGGAEQDAVIGELRLVPERYHALHAAALAALLGVRGWQGEDAAGVTSRWLDQQALPEGADSAARVARRVRQRQIEDVLRALPPVLLRSQLLLQLEVHGEYEALARRAARKVGVLAARDDVPGLESLHGLELLHLEQWYFGDVLGGWIPDDVDDHAAQLGYCGLPGFHRALIAEYLFRQCEEGGDDP